MFVFSRKQACVFVGFLRALVAKIFTLQAQPQNEIFVEKFFIDSKFYNPLKHLPQSRLSKLHAGLIISIYPQRTSSARS